MRPRKYRKTAKGFADFERKFGWTTRNAWSLLCITHGGRRTIPNKKMETELKDLAAEYLNWFKKEPTKTHLFPITGTFFQFEFAKGVHDAAQLAGEIPKVRIRTITPFKEAAPRFLEPQAKKLNLKQTGIVLHDSVSGRRTIGVRADACNIHENEIGIHRLYSQQTSARAKVPLPKQTKWVRVKGFEKDFSSGADKPKLKFDDYLPKSEWKFLRRAIYAAGVAAGRELLKEKK